VNHPPWSRPRSMVRMLESLPFTEADVRLAAGARSFGEAALRMERNLMKILDQSGGRTASASRPFAPV
jgi:hypothetical protein